MTPTIGRIVHYHPGTEDQFYGEGVVLAAIVTQVKPNGVNLMVLAPNGQTVFGKSDVLLFDGKSAVPYASWPPEIEKEPEPLPRYKPQIDIERSIPRYPLDEPDDSDPAEEAPKPRRAKKRKK